MPIKIRNSSLKKEYTERINNKLKTDWKFALRIFQMELTEEILKELIKRNLNRSDLARLLSVSRSHISQLLNGKINLRLNTYFKLCFEIGIIPQVNYNRMENYAFEKRKTCEVVEELPTQAENIETKGIAHYDKVA
jgi:transcriptional regulator with XRE-family HTH domain